MTEIDQKWLKMTEINQKWPILMYLREWFMKNWHFCIFSGHFGLSEVVNNLWLQAEFQANN